MAIGEAPRAQRLDERPLEDTHDVTAAAERLDDDASATLYLHSSASPPAKRRQAVTRGRFDALVDADILPEATARSWDGQTAALDVDGTPTLDVYDEFTAAVGDRGHLDPFFRESSTGFGDRSVVLPVLCLAIRRGDTVTGLYPCWHEGTHWSVEDGLEALETGEDVENLR
ncbi:HTH domain-containing protein [Halorarius litoreus]|uniref:HTH domain-containing protein n=1 Tax=Halorarius litoreus TaxID=2962676 RepID=UPI0020CD96AF|nr:HTH domain-containing protein [Halorarius litoreus]